jgi:hypothetical protein
MNQYIIEQYWHGEKVGEITIEADSKQEAIDEYEANATIQVSEA